VPAGALHSYSHMAPSQSTDDLIRLIETHYHAVHRRELPELVRLARRVEMLHGSHPMVPAGITALLGRLARELTEHMRSEEKILFTLMRHHRLRLLGRPLKAILAEHDDHLAELGELELITQGFEAPPGASLIWQTLCIGAQKLTCDLLEHIHLENDVLFPRFRT
jgi:regulator of cell morphogenesis and NO signaling